MGVGGGGHWQEMWEFRIIFCTCLILLILGSPAFVFLLLTFFNLLFFMSIDSYLLLLH